MILKIVGMFLLILSFLCFRRMLKKWIISFRRAQHRRAKLREARAYTKAFWKEQERITKGWEEQAKRQKITYKGAPEFASVWEV